jgi:hypothetical protein
MGKLKDTQNETILSEEDMKKVNGGKNEPTLPRFRSGGTKPAGQTYHDIILDFTWPDDVE